MINREVDLEGTDGFVNWVAFVHLKQAVDAIRAGKTEIADTHFKRARETQLDGLIAKYPDEAYQSGDLFVIQAERRKRNLPEFLVAEDTEKT